MVPMLMAARRTSYRDECHERQRLLGQAWEGYLQDHNEQFPALFARDIWKFGGVRFPPDGEPFVDYVRPLNPYLPYEYGDPRRITMFRCPADRGIGVGGAGAATVYRAYGSSFRPNELLFDASAAGLGDEHRGLSRGEISAPPSRLLVNADATWYEYAEGVDDVSGWHGDHAMCNCLFLDGSVRFREILPRDAAGPVVFDPRFGSGEDE